MAQNRGKQFEQVIQKAFLKIPEVSIDRLHDQTTGYAGSSNICDFVVYKKPYEYYIECKSVHGNTLSIYGNDPKHKYGNISNKQWEGLTEKSSIEGVGAGVICWWVDKGVTAFIPIAELSIARREGYKSIRFNHEPFLKYGFIELKGEKKRVFFDYDMDSFFHAMQKQERRH